MRNLTHEFFEYVDESDYFPTRKPSAMQTYYEYNGGYPEGHEMTDEILTIITVK